MVFINRNPTLRVLNIQVVWMGNSIHFIQGQDVRPAMDQHCIPWLLTHLRILESEANIILMDDIPSIT